MPGHEAVSLGAVYAGCRFISAYPMSPSTGIITWLSQHEKAFGLFSEQAEDEIAAINMAIGAGFAGARAMTATSGGGFALMTEGVSLAGMTETPVVIVLAQRPGPATGLPTRTAQGDLLFAINAGHGEFPRLVMAPADAEEAFQKTVKAFNLAEKYQIPVILLTDQFLADSQFSYEKFDFKKVVRNFIEQVRTQLIPTVGMIFRFKTVSRPGCFRDRVLTWLALTVMNMTNWVTLRKTSAEKRSA